MLGHRERLYVNFWYYKELLRLFVCREVVKLDVTYAYMNIKVEEFINIIPR